MNNNMSAATLLVIGVLGYIGSIMWATTSGSGVSVAVIGLLVGAPIGTILTLVWLRRHPRHKSSESIEKRD